MQTFTSTESLDRQSAAGADVDAQSIWCSVSDVDTDVNVTVPTSRWLNVLTE